MKVNTKKTKLMKVEDKDNMKVFLKHVRIEQVKSTVI